MPMTLRARKLPAGFWAGAGKTKSKQPARGRGRKPRVGKALTKAIKAVVQRTEEKKFCGRSIEVAVSHNAAITSADLYPVLPFMTQGPGYNQRNGDKVRPTSLIIDGAVSFNDYGQGVHVPLTCVVMCLQARKIRDPNQISTAPINLLLDNGTGATSWDGSTLNSLYPINHDEFEVLASRRFRIGNNSVENPLSLSKRYRMKIRTPKVLMYDGGASVVNNFAPFLVLGWCRDDGTGTGPTDTWVIHTASARLTYTDA